MLGIYINSYNAICNLGKNIEEIFSNVVIGKNNFFTFDERIVKGEVFPFGRVNGNLPIINDEKYNLRCNRMLLHCLELMSNDINVLLKNYDKSRIGVVIGSTNSGVDEFEVSGDIDHSQIANPAGFVRKYLGLSGYYCGISTACTSGVKAFSTAKKLMETGICDAVIVGAADALSKMPVYGFRSLEVLSNESCIPFSKNRKGINIGEGAALFVLEKTQFKNSILLCSTGETSDAYHSATPDPEGIEASHAMKLALDGANLKSSDIDYINLHGTGTISNDLMEANAVYRIFSDKTLVSSTKSLTGHCLGASGGIEAAVCCAILDKRINPAYLLPPHSYDGVYDQSLPVLNLVKKGKTVKRLEYCMNNAFGFGGSNAVMILGRGNA